MKVAPKIERRNIKILVEVGTFQNIKNAARIKEEERLMALFNKHIKEKGLVVDFGCGTSYYTGQDTIGLDLDREMLLKADLAHKILADYNYCPLKPSSVDGVVMCHSIEHTNRPWQPLEQAKRILKQNGIVAVSFPNLRSLQTLYDLIFKGRVRGVGIYHSDHLTALTPEALAVMFRQIGFKLVDESGDVVYFPKMRKLHLMKLGFWLALIFPKWSNVYIAIGKA